MMKVVVTGGAGFIGSHLAGELTRRGYHVIILDNLSTGRVENLKNLSGNENIQFIQGSIDDLSLLNKLFRGVIYVFHQAAIPSVPRSIANPLVSHESNLTGTLKILLAAKDNGIKKVVYASSSSVYGDTPTLPKKEDMIPNPKSPYAITKLGGEYYCQVFHQVYGLSTICLRYFNVYGPKQNPNSEYAAAIPRFISNVLQKNPPTIFGDGEQTRDFTFIKDVVEANILAAESDVTGVFNIGTGQSTSINGLVDLIISLTRINIIPVHEKQRIGDIKDSLADISKSTVFGYKQKYNLEQGLRETIFGM